MKVQILSQEIKTLVRRDDDLMLMLAKANKVRVDSVGRWLTNNDDILTTATNLSIIREGLKLADNVILTESKELEEKA